jgi:hypothetical protein
MVTLLAPLKVLPVRFAMRAVFVEFDFNVRFLAFKFNVAVVKLIVPYTSRALPRVADAPLFNVRLFNERVAADVCVKFKVPAVPPIVKLDVDEPPDAVPVNVPLPDTAPLSVKVFEAMERAPDVNVRPR